MASSSFSRIKGALIHRIFAPAKSWRPPKTDSYIPNWFESQKSVSVASTAAATNANCAKVLEEVHLTRISTNRFSLKTSAISFQNTSSVSSAGGRWEREKGLSSLSVRERTGQLDSLSAPLSASSTGALFEDSNRFARGQIPCLVGSVSTAEMFLKFLTFQVGASLFLLYLSKDYFEKSFKRVQRFIYSTSQS
eukprot:Nk52_evm75s210 gene=Nk52_evmTU75s210